MTSHPSLLLLIGLPGSGKSTLARHLIAKDQRRQLISTDTIRCQLFGDEAIQGSWLLIWQEVKRQFQQAVIYSQSVPTAIYDATNVQQRHRLEVISLARSSGFTRITGLWVDTPIGLCLERNQQRDRQVPEDIILQMYRQLCDAPPSLAEGLNLIHRLSEERIKVGTEIAIAQAARTELNPIQPFDKLWSELI